MQPAATWDVDPSHPHADSVVGRLNERCRNLRGPASSAVILVFAQPDSWSARQLCARRSYFDVRSGEDWDVFFPGYYRYGSMGDPEAVKLDEYWGFSPRAFDSFRRELEQKSESRWRSDGESELVAMNATLVPGGPVVDFASVVNGPLTEPDISVTTRTLAQAIERLGQQVDDRAEDADYGLAEVVGKADEVRAKEGVIGRIGIGAAGGVAAALVRHALGLP